MKSHFQTKLKVMVHAKRCDAKVQNFHFLKKLPGELTGESNSNVALCLHKGARGIVEIEARERITRYKTKSDGPRPGDCYHGGLTVLSRSATRCNRGNSPYSHHSPFFTLWNSEHRDLAILLPCEARLGDGS